MSPCMHVYAMGLCVWGGGLGGTCLLVQSDILVAHVISEAPPPPSTIIFTASSPLCGGNFPILLGSAIRMRFLAITAA